MEGVKPVAPVQPPLIGITFWTCNTCAHVNKVTNLSRTRQECAMCTNVQSMSDYLFEPTAKKPPANTTKRQSKILQHLFVSTNRDTKKKKTASKKRFVKDASIDADSNDDSVDDQLDTKKPPAKKKKTASRKPSMKEIASRKRSHKEIFDDNILKLKEFKVIHGHVKVIKSYNPSLYS